MKRILAGIGVLVLVIAPATGDDKARDDKPFTDAEFVKMAASCNKFQVDAGKLAQTKATNDAVKKFADTLVTDHTKATEELTTAAKAAGIEVTDKMSEKCQKCYDTINAASGGEFDKVFMTEQVKYHEHAVTVLKKATTEAKNSELKAFATKALPTMEEHLKLAKEIQQKIGQ